MDIDGPFPSTLVVVWLCFFVLLGQRKVGGSVEKSIIESLRGRNGRVVNFEVSEDKTGFIITEACDDYFSLKVSKKDLIRLGQELIDLANNSDVQDLDFEPKGNW